MPEAVPEATTAGRPNILLVTTDQMRADHSGCYGNPVIRTPALDSLAAGGVLFTRAYCNNPTCMPNRASIVTGRLPRNHRVWRNGISMDEREETIAHMLNREGYHTAVIGKGHLSSAGGEPRAPFYDSLAAWRRGVIGPDWT
ncbi:MAG: sulfatase-like hydrolase/transferase, partial [Planctomycetota bacterium]